MILFMSKTPPTTIYPLSLHDALPISQVHSRRRPNICVFRADGNEVFARHEGTCGCRAKTSFPSARKTQIDRKSTRLNSSHSQISYAVFCFKKKTIVVFPGGSYRILAI